MIEDKKVNSFENHNLDLIFLAYLSANLIVKSNKISSDPPNLYKFYLELHLL